MSAMDERTALRSTTRAALWRLAGPWWMFLLTGIAWLIASVLILRITTASVTTVGVLMGVLFLVAMLNEWFIAAVSPTWRWAHIALGVLFAVGAGWAFARPYNAFWALASVLGLLLILRGTFDLISAVATKDINSAWWLGMLVGILEIFLGFWASQQRLPVQGALLLVWVGFFALFRGISEIVVAFQLRSAQRP
jgi:hypothetical protein